MTIRTRIVVGVSVLTAVVFLLAGVITVFSLRTQLLAQIDDEITVRAGGAMQGLGRGPFGGLGLGAQGAIDRIFEERDIAIILVPTAGDPTVVPAGSFEDPDPLPDIDLASLPTTGPITVNAVEGDLRYRVAVHEVAGGSVVLAATLEATEASVASLAKDMALIGVGAVILAASGTAWIVRRGIRPIDEMIETAERVGDGTLSERVPIADESTEVGSLATAINAMLGRVEEAVAVREASEARLRRFASDASHELRTPLTSIRGYAELYRQGGGDAEQVERSFGRIESEGARMARILEDLLLLTRFDQGRGIEVADVDICEVVRETVEDARAVAPGRPVTLAIPDAPLVVRCDRDRVSQVMSNLLGNAREHTPEGTPVTVTVTDADPLRVTVRDEGEGIPPEAAEAVFERFSRLAPTGHGSGLGLAIVRAIVEAHGGSVWIEGGPGTTVVVELPRVSGVSPPR